MNPQRIVFINRFYWPEEQATAQLLTDLAEGLATAGHPVVVVTSRPAHAAISAHETHAGVEVHRVRSFRTSRQTLLGRVCELVSFYPGAVWKLFSQVRREDWVIAMTDPPLIGVLASVVAQARGARLVHWIQDIYPEIAIDLTRHRWLSVFYPWRNHAWRQATACLVPGTDMAATVCRAGVCPSQVLVFPNWAPAGVVPASLEEIRRQRAAWALEGKFVVAYSGNLGRVHDLDPILDVAAALRAEPDFAFIIVGDGARRADLESAAEAQGLPNVRFLPPQPRETLAPSLAAADVHFVTLRNGAERCVFPSKLYGIAKVGRPVIFIGAADCEFARLVREHRLGLAFTREQVSSIVSTLQTLRTDALQRARLGEAAAVFAGNGLAQATRRCRELLARSLPIDPTPTSESPSR